MYIPVPTQRSCARAWVAAALAIIEFHDEGYNVIIDVENPVVHDDQDSEVITVVDRFLRKLSASPKGFDPFKPGHILYSNCALS